MLSAHMSGELESSSVPPLPFELISQILEIAASSHRKTCYNLCLVSSWSRSLALPYIYTTIVVKDGPADRAWDAITSHLDLPTAVPGLPALQVRNLWMTEQDPGRTDVILMYAACRNLTNLAMSTSVYHELASATTPASNHQPFAFIERPRPHTPIHISTSRLCERPKAGAKLSILLLLFTEDQWEGGNFVWRAIGGSPILFQHITHLRLDRQPKERWRITYYPRLTHLAFPYTRYYSDRHQLADLEMMLSTRISLEMVVIVVLTDITKPEFVEEMRDWVVRKRATDGRAYAVETVSTTLQEEWEDETCGGPSIWDRAVMYTESLGLFTPNQNHRTFVMVKTTTILFDCDNTLVLSEELAFEACAELANEILAKNNISDRYTGPQLLVDFVGQNFRGMLLGLTQKYNLSIPANELDEYVLLEETRVISTLKAKLQPCVGVDAQLEKVAESKKYLMAAVSSSAHRRVKASVEKVGQDKYFPSERIFSAATSLPKPTSKPDPAIYLFACKTLGKEPGECVAVEDSKSGTLSAVRAGIPVIAYVGSYEGKEMQAKMGKALQEQGALVVMDHWDQFEDCLAAVEKS